MADGREETMGVIAKALTMLDVLAGMGRDAGLTEIATACAYDKATTRRFLVELERQGFVEQHPQSRKYRLGAAVLRLGRIREASFPFLRTVQPFVRQLADLTGETVHVSELSNGRLSTIYVEESGRANRVIVSVGTILPFHASASGLACLACCPADMIEVELAKPITAHTEFTMIDAGEFRRRIEETRKAGYSVNNQGMEVGVISTSSAIVPPAGMPLGSITIAAPLVRTDKGRIREFGQAVRTAAHRISEAFAGPSGNPTIWDRQGLE